MATQLFSAIPTWYALVAAAFSLYYGTRGVVTHLIAAEQQNAALAKNGAREIKTWENVVIRYVQDFIFNAVCCIAGFLSFFASYFLAQRVVDPNNTSAGIAIIIVAGFLLGIVGVSGQLPYLLLQGRLPRIA